MNVTGWSRGLELDFDLVTVTGVFTAEQRLTNADIAGRPGPVLAALARHLPSCTSIGWPPPARCRPGTST
ncbi:MAG TPA: hypothetical protein VEO01_25035 [Pseudonocardiaceae bacterium]|nr:hypothetical protein [Pseudonocardiaceae bacterium]